MYENSLTTQRLNGGAIVFAVCEGVFAKQYDFQRSPEDFWEPEIRWYMQERFPGMEQPIQALVQKVVARLDLQGQHCRAWYVGDVIEFLCFLLESDPEFREVEFQKKEVLTEGIIERL